MKNHTERKIRCLFGTDGVRDVANRGMMMPEMAMRLGRAYALYLTENGIPRPRLVMGRDTRRSGQMLESAVIAGLTSSGASVSNLGVAPTPEISFAVRSSGFHGGVVISASHNPAEYNGIKFLDSSGTKLSDEQEIAIEEYMEDSFIDEWRPTGASIGTYDSFEQMHELYLERLWDFYSRDKGSQLSCVVDCANGAASVLISNFVEKYDLLWKIIGNEPDGLNINDGFGVMDLGALKKEVIEQKADAGIAFDGDADRVLLVDPYGREIDGDIMMWMLSIWLKSRDSLGSGLTATVMSNMALEDHLLNEGIPVHRCPVGDRYVYRTMNEKGSRLGGEQSGHLIIDGFSTTGDGPCTALLFLRACMEMGFEISTLVDKFHRYPQMLTNIFLSDRKNIAGDPELKNIVTRAEAKLDGFGRVFIRPSGTEPLLRVLVEARDRELLESVSYQLVQDIRQLYSIA